MSSSTISAERRTDHAVSAETLARTADRCGLSARATHPIVSHGEARGGDANKVGLRGVWHNVGAREAARTDSVCLLGDLFPPSMRGGQVPASPLHASGL